MLASVVVTIALTRLAHAAAKQIANYGACGGLSMCGKDAMCDAVCIGGWKCQKLNSWYWKCLSIASTTIQQSTPGRPALLTAAPCWCHHDLQWPEHTHM